MNFRAGARRIGLAAAQALLLLVMQAFTPPVNADTGPTSSDLVAAQAEVARIYAKVTEIGQLHEKASHAAAKQLETTLMINRKLSTRRHRMARLRSVVGRVANQQYRNGGLPITALFLTSNDPQTFLRNLSTARSADLAMAKAVSTLRSSSQQLERDQTVATAALRELKSHQREVTAAKRQIEEKLARAREWERRARARSEDPPENPIHPCEAKNSDQQILPQAPNNSVHAAGDSLWMPPVRNYELTARFGDIGPNWQHRHTGQDFAVPTGTPVYAVGRGTVVSVGCSDAFGNSVIIRHGDGYYTQYAHLSAIHSGYASSVEAGQRIGESGCTGNCTGPHLHFEVRITPHPGSGIDPVAWLGERGVAV